MQETLWLQLQTWPQLPTAANNDYSCTPGHSCKSWSSFFSKAIITTLMVHLFNSWSPFTCLFILYNRDTVNVWSSFQLTSTKQKVRIRRGKNTTFHVFLFASVTCFLLGQRFSIHFEAHTPSGRKNHFCTPCTIWCIVFCIIREVRTPRSPFSHPQLRTAVLGSDPMQFTLFDWKLEESRYGCFWCSAVW